MLVNVKFLADINIIRNLTRTIELTFELIKSIHLTGVLSSLLLYGVLKGNALIGIEKLSKITKMFVHRNDHTNII